MEVSASLKSLRVSPRKARLLADAVKGAPAVEAAELLDVLNHKSAPAVAKLIRSAIANATNNHGLEKATLKVRRLVVNEGPTLKRWQPANRGSAHHILKRTSRLEVILEAPDDTPKAPVKKATKALKSNEAPKVQSMVEALKDESLKGAGKADAEQKGFTVDGQQKAATKGAKQSVFRRKTGE